MLKTAIGFILIMLVCSCNQQSHPGALNSDNDKNQKKLKTGLTFETGPNLGLRYNVEKGILYSFIHTTTVITNDSTIPIQLQMRLSEEINFPNNCNDSTYKLMLLPKEFTPDSATLYNNMFDIDDVLHVSKQKPYHLSTSLKPNEYCVITIGILNHHTSNCGGVPRVVFANENMGLYESCDREINTAISSDPKLEIGLKLEIYNDRKFIPPEDHCIVIPCGEISYPEL